MQIEHVVLGASTSNDEGANGERQSGVIDPNIDVSEMVMKMRRAAWFDEGNKSFLLLQAASIIERMVSNVPFHQREISKRSAAG